MEKNYIISIDPGKAGGISCLYNGKLIDISDMPSTPELFYEHLLFLGLPNNYKGNLHIIIENVHAMPTDGSRQAFTFGRGLGQMEGVFAAMGLLGTLERISPSVWMKYFDLKRNKEESKHFYKKRIKELASDLAKQPLTLKTADAYLIGRYYHENYKKISESKI